MSTRRWTGFELWTWLCSLHTIPAIAVSNVEVQRWVVSQCSQWPFCKTLYNWHMPSCTPHTHHTHAHTRTHTHTHTHTTHTPHTRTHTHTHTHITHTSHNLIHTHHIHSNDSLTHLPSVSTSIHIHTPVHVQPYIPKVYTSTRHTHTTAPQHSTVRLEEVLHLLVGEKGLWTCAPGT